MRGFTEGEGCFTIGIKKKMSTGRPRGRPKKFSLLRSESTPHELWQVFCVFRISQTGLIGEQVLNEIKSLFGCGKVFVERKRKNPKWSPVYNFTVYAIEDHTSKIIPFFEAHTLLIKAEAYAIWKNAVMLLLTKQHGKENLEKLISLKERLELVNSKKGKPYAPVQG